MAGERNGIFWEKTGTRLRLEMQRFGIVMIASFIVGIVLFIVGNSFFTMTSFKRTGGEMKNVTHFLKPYLVATIDTWIVRNGHRIYPEFEGSDDDVYSSRSVKDYCRRELFKGFSVWQVIRPFALSFGGFALVFGVGCFFAFGKKTETRKHVRGSRQVTVKSVNEQMLTEAVKKSGKKNGKKTRKKDISRLLIPAKGKAYLAIPRTLLNQHMELFGDTGTGKTTVISAMMADATKNKDVCVVNDPEGELTAQFYDKDRGDIILDVDSPLCPYWTPWSEIDSVYAKETFLTALMPDSSNPQDTFWIESGRSIISAIMEKLETIKDNPDFHDVLDILNQPTKHIYNFLQSTDALNIMSPNESGQDQGMISHLKKDLRFLTHLKRNGDRDDFSCKKWVKEPTGWIFLRSNNVNRTVMTRLTSIWIDCLAMHMLGRNMEGGKAGRVYFFIDEIHTLKRLDSVVELLTRVRKRNVSLVFGTQNVGQLRDIYGKEKAQTMLSQPKFKLVFRTSEPESARYCSEMIGEREVEMIQESLSAGVQSIRDGVSYNTQVTREPLMMASDIQNLEDLSACFIYPGAGTVKLAVKRVEGEAREPIDEEAIREEKYGKPEPEKEQPAPEPVKELKKPTYTPNKKQIHLCMAFRNTIETEAMPGEPIKDVRIAEGTAKRCLTCNSNCTITRRELTVHHEGQKARVIMEPDRTKPEEDPFEALSKKTDVRQAASGDASRSSNETVAVDTIAPEHTQRDEEEVTDKSTEVAYAETDAVIADDATEETSQSIPGEEADPIVEMKDETPHEAHDDAMEEDETKEDMPPEKENETHADSEDSSIASPDGQASGESDDMSEASEETDVEEEQSPTQQQDDVLFDPPSLKKQEKTPHIATVWSETPQ